MYVCNLQALAGMEVIGLHPFGDAKTVLALTAFTLGMASAIFLSGKRTNLAFLLYQIALYPLLDILGIMGSGE